jgi:hypothetical protein
LFKFGWFFKKNTEFGVSKDSPINWNFWIKSKELIAPLQDWGIELAELVLREKSNGVDVFDILDKVFVKVMFWGALIVLKFTIFEARELVLQFNKLRFWFDKKDFSKLLLIIEFV